MEMFWPSSAETTSGKQRKSLNYHFLSPWKNILMRFIDRPRVITKLRIAMHNYTKETEAQLTRLRGQRFVQQCHQRSIARAVQLHGLLAVQIPLDLLVQSLPRELCELRGLLSNSCEVLSEFRMLLERLAACLNLKGRQNTISSR